MRSAVDQKQRIVVKVGSSTLQHPQTGDLDYIKMDVLVRELCNLRNQGKDVVLVTSGAIAVGKRAIQLCERPTQISQKQACAAIGQARLMTTYQKIFSEYSHITAQILITKNTIIDNLNRYNAQNTFEELLKLGVIPIVNENDTISTYEIEDEIGDNDTLAAIVSSLIGADLLILLSDIDGLYSDDPRSNPDATFISCVETIDEALMDMGKSSTGSNVGTGGMNTKLSAAKLTTSMGSDMVIASGKDMRILHRIMDGREVGTYFKAKKDPDFDLIRFVNRLHAKD